MGRKTPEHRRLRVYEQWQGNERFFCWGYCVTGPSWKSGMGSLALLIAPTVVFLVFVVPYMASNVSPVFWVVSCILPMFCASMLMMTSCRDPGILPRQEPDEEWLQARKPRSKDLNVNGHRVTVRYNDTCHFYQPPRAHHCSVNDNCIERFDHHCPWVGTTIGKRNYRTFLLFIYSTSVYIAWTFGVCLGSLFVKHAELQAAAAARGPQDSTDTLTGNPWLQTLGQSGAAMALMIFTFIFFWFVCGLSGFHTWLVATNQTTYENFRYNHNQVPNPYSEGLFGNCASVWCVRIPPSKVDFRAYLNEVVREPVELGYTEWVPPGAATPPRSDLQMQMQMSPLGGSSSTGQGPPQAGDSPVLYGSGTAADVQQQYGSTNGNVGGQYARAAGAGAGAGAAAVAARYAHGMGPQSSGSQQGLPTPGSQQSFDSIPESDMPVSRSNTLAYSSSSPPPLGPSHTSAAGPQGPLAAGLAAVQPSQQGLDSSTSSVQSGAYYTPQGSVVQAPGPLASSLQQQQQPMMQQQQQYPGQGPSQPQQQQQRRAASIELPAGAANGPGGWQQQQQQAGGMQQQQQPGLRTAVQGSGAGPLSHHQVHLEVQEPHQQPVSS